jgi:hypothetical protein
MNSTTGLSPKIVVAGRFGKSTGIFPSKTSKVNFVETPIKRPARVSRGSFP